jgi:tRNA1Val (adenine37-N6)-methyltransferase
VETTLDSVRDVRLYQRKDGYRFSLDAVLLFSFVALRRVGRAADLGAGSGIVGLLLAKKYPDSRVALIEIQKGLHELSAKNIHINGLGSRVEAVRADIRKLPPGLGTFDVVLSNPPFRKPLSGRLSDGEEKAVARHEMKISLRELVASAAGILRERGRFFIVYHPLRLSDLMHELSRGGLEPKRLRFVHGKAASEAKIVLLEAARHGRAGLKVEPPLFVYGEDGGYSAEIREIYGQ